MADVEVRVTGAGEAAADLEQLARDAAQLDLSDVGDSAKARLAALSPRLTGRLAGSWSTDTGPSRVSVGTDLDYGAIQNYGSRHVPALHFAERAAELITDDAGRLVGQELDRIIGRL